MRTSLTGLVCAAALVTACALLPADQPTQPTPTATATATATVAETSTPAAVATATAEPSPEITAPPVTESPATAPPVTEPPATALPPGTPRPTPDDDEPPSATLTAGDTSVDGQLGSYCWGSDCATAPGFPKKSLPLLELEQSDVTLAFTLDQEVTFVGWSATYRARETSRSYVLGAEGEDYDSDGTEPPMEFIDAAFPAPPVGDWYVAVSLQFIQGDALYQWHVVVE